MKINNIFNNRLFSITNWKLAIDVLEFYFYTKLNILSYISEHIECLKEVDHKLHWLQI